MGFWQLLLQQVHCLDVQKQSTEQKTVATVGDEKVTLGLASYMVRDQQAQTMSYYNMLMSQYGVSGSASNVWDQKGDDGKTVGESSKDGVMKTINQLYVLKAHAADYDVTITDDEEKAIKEAAAEFIKDNDEKILKKLAVSEDDNRYVSGTGNDPQQDA